jgi:transposase-like protein
MTSKTRREFTEEFKREAVLLLESSGRPLMQVAKEFGIHPSILRNWRARGHGPVGSAAVQAAAGKILLPLRRSRQKSGGSRRNSNGRRWSATS